MKAAVGAPGTGILRCQAFVQCYEYVCEAHRAAAEATRSSRALAVLELVREPIETCECEYNTIA